MSKREHPILHRDDPAKEPLVGHIKVTRDDWLNVARDVLVSDGVAEVKVLALGQRLDVSRSSFYWYFKSRKHLLEALLDDWEARNTRTIVAQCELPADTIGEAVGNFFKCFLNPDLFDRGLDFAVREWSRRDGAVRQRIDQADRERLAAVTQMFERHGFTPYEADVRARILYYMQLGYHALDVREPMQARCDRLAGYLKGFTGQEASDEVLATMIAYAKEQDGKQ
ncbi:TetR/AcrR family transcriptional regulator [Roseovarius indicus]|uniref:TetR family regulatory protein n=1 Tax=Roseovarius indicus TaxID=540747 RepID=A0A0T5P1I2_9RHOB|nr:TetR/AcrR family transcriptional regulator [Roseovarius indicus]KRS14980.1 TetR family transcriptional regulator [Roseovarius indicus]QEW28548.1 TetR family regulatory protein [Roseovarius indicus]SFE08662.1 transcriptional regulator, TetR family [Roseovarius indicus]